MNKDAILATIIGFLIGAAITSAILFGPQLLTSIPRLALPSLPQFGKKTEEGKVLTNTITGSENETAGSPDGILPENEAIVTDDSVTVSGKAAPGAIVTLVGQIEDQVTKADDTGTFSKRIKLKEGLNLITIIYQDNGDTRTFTREIYQTKEAL